MTSTQRAESMNAFLNKYLTKKSTLSQFVVQFETALRRLFERENYADHESKFKTPDFVSSLNIEKARSVIKKGVSLSACFKDMNVVVWGF